MQSQKHTNQPLIYLVYHPLDKAKAIEFRRLFDPDDQFLRFRSDLYDAQLPGADPEDDYAELSVMEKLIYRFIRLTSVTLVLLGPLTSRSGFIDMELRASLIDHDIHGHNGLLGISLPEHQPQKHGYPPRLAINLGSEGRPGYAEAHPWPEDRMVLMEWTLKALKNRTEKAELLQNPTRKLVEQAKKPI